jgi:hypothetical protein
MARGRGLGRGRGRGAGRPRSGKKKNLGVPDGTGPRARAGLCTGGNIGATGIRTINGGGMRKGK